MARTQQRRGQQRGSPQQRGRQSQKGKQQGRGQGGGQPKLSLTEMAVGEGITEFVKSRPKFMGQENFLASYIDMNKTQEYSNKATKEFGKKYGKVDPEKLKDTLVDYVISGEAFNQEGKEVLLSHSWDTKSRSFWQFGARAIMKGERDLNRAMTSFRELYNLVSSGDYQTRNPALAKAVAGVYDLGFTDAALNVLYKNGQLDKTKYITLKQAVVDKAEQGKKYIAKEVERSALPEKVEKAVAAAIAGIGAAIVLGTNSITGNAIGSITGNAIKITETPLTPLLIGVGMIITGILLGFRKK